MGILSLRLLRPNTWQLSTAQCSAVGHCIEISKGIQCSTTYAICFSTFVAHPRLTLSRVDRCSSCVLLVITVRMCVRSWATPLRTSASAWPRLLDELPRSTRSCTLGLAACSLSMQYLCPCYPQRATSGQHTACVAVRMLTSRPAIALCIVAQGDVPLYSKLGVVCSWFPGHSSHHCAARQSSKDSTMQQAPCSTVRHRAGQCGTAQCRSEQCSSRAPQSACSTAQCMAGPNSPAQDRATQRGSTAQCSTMQFRPVQYNTTQWDKISQCSTTPQCSTEHRSTGSFGQHGTAHHSKTQHSTAQNSAAQSSVAQHSTAQFISVPCNAGQTISAQSSVDHFCTEQCSTARPRAVQHRTAKCRTAKNTALQHNMIHHLSIKAFGSGLLGSDFRPLLFESLADFPPVGCTNVSPMATGRARAQGTWNRATDEFCGAEPAPKIHVGFR